MYTQDVTFIAVDVQNDFVEGGALGVDGGKQVAQGIRQFVRAYGDRFRDIFVTRDWHIDPGAHFDTWPVHCQADTHGAEFEENIAAMIEENRDRVEVVSKGMFSDGYSGFEGTILNKQKPMTIVSPTVVIAGIATDFCVKATVMDALKAGRKVIVLRDKIAGVTAEGAATAIREMEEAGAMVMTAGNLIANWGA